MIEQALDPRAQLAELQFIATSERGRSRPILGASVMIASAEHDCDKAVSIARGKRRLACQSHFNDAPARNMRAWQARGQCRCIVRDHEVAGSQQLDQFGAWPVTHVPVLVEV
jgi:hypothetical protein